MSNILNFIRPDKKLESIQANRIAFFRMDESFAEFIKQVEEQEFVILGIEWNETDPCKLAFVLSHEEPKETPAPYLPPLDAPQVPKVEAIEAIPLTEKRPTLGQIIEKYIGGEVDRTK